MYQKQADGTFISSDGKTASTSEISQTLADTQSDAAIYVPDSASPNYSMRNKEDYTAARKAAAPRDEVKGYLDSFLRENTANVWNEADDYTKDALYEYTCSSYMDINETLRSGTSNPNKEVKAEIDAITEAISKSKLDIDIWLVRGVDKEGAAASLGVTYDELTNPDFDPSVLIGKVASDEAFMSCGTTEGSGIPSDVKYSIYCPKGTEALYAEPFSEYGSGGGRSWDGEEEQDYFGSEFETILQRGTKCKVTNAYYDDMDVLVIEMDVVAQKYS